MKNTLQEYCERARARFRPSYTSPTWEESEELAWSVLDYGSSFEYTPADVAWIRENHPALLELLDDDDGATPADDAPAPAESVQAPAAPAESVQAPASPSPCPIVARIVVESAATGRPFARFAAFNTRASALRFLSGVIFCAPVVARLYGNDGRELGAWRYGAGCGRGRKI